MDCESPFILFYPSSCQQKQAIGSLVALVALIAIGVGVGVGVSKSNSNKNNSSSSSSQSGGSDSDSTSGSGSSGGTSQTDPNDPSSFTKDPDLHKAFYGIAYTPEGSLLPDCGNSLDAVIKDIQVYDISSPSEKKKVPNAPGVDSLATYWQNSFIWR